MKTLSRIYHTWDKWECYRAGFFEESLPGKSHEECERGFMDFFLTPGLFESVLPRVLKEWPNSCEHNLTNENLNRIAWLGQAAVCLHTGIPSRYKVSYLNLPEDVRQDADAVALQYLNVWLLNNGYPETDGKRKHKANNIY